MTTTTIEDLDELIATTKKFYVNNKEELDEIRELEIYLDEQYYELDHLKSNLDDIRSEYISERRGLNDNKAIDIFEKITQIITGKKPKSAIKSGDNKPILPEVDPELVIGRKYNKVDYFIKNVNFQKQRSVFETRDETYTKVDDYIPDQYRYLRPFEKVCAKNKMPLSEYLVTGYHQSGLSINQYIAQNELFNQLNHHFNSSPTSKNINKSRDIMVNYLLEYEKYMAKPLPSDPLTLQKQSRIRPFKDDITIIMSYMNEINNGIQNVLSQNASYPLQLDVFFIAPGYHTDLNLHSLGGKILDIGVKSDKESRKQGAVDAVADIYGILRRAANDINRSNKQRFVMLIVRSNEDDTSDDTVYIFKPDLNNNVAPKFISDSCELTYLINSKTAIIPGLNSFDEGVLGWNHHLHSNECNKIYLSYGDYKSRVFRANILQKLQCLFDHHNDRKHVIGNSVEVDFMKYYKDLIDTNYSEVGEYWFNNSKAYECYVPSWNPQNCRAMGNVFIPKNNPSCCTKDLLEYIFEKDVYQTPEKLYYKLDYTVGMQIVDKQTVCIRKDNKIICLLNTELHHKISKQPLYALIEKNSWKSKQKWKIIDYDHISQAFMTPDELVENYGIFTLDLPRGSRRLHDGFTALKAEIDVTKQLIRTTNWSHIRIVQSKQNVSKMHNNSDDEKASINGSRNGQFKISERRFKQLALKSLIRSEAEGTELTPIAHFKFRRNKYHLEKLLPVYIPEHDKYVAISFWFNQLSEKGRTQASGVCLDLVDMKNKANLIQTIPADSFLNFAKEENTINNLTIGQDDTPPTKQRKNNNNRQKKKNKRKKKQQRNNSDNDNNNNNNNNNSNHNNNRNKRKNNKKNKKMHQNNSKAQQQQHQHQHQPQAQPQIPPQIQVQSQYPSMPVMNASPMSSAMSSANSSPNMHNISPSPTQPIFVPSKVPNTNNNQYQSQRIVPQQLQQGLNAIPQSVPQLLTTSSIGSVASQLTAPMASMPSMISTSSVPTTVTAFPLSSVPNTIPNTPTLAANPASMSRIPSIPMNSMNMNMNVVNHQINSQIQQFKQSEAYFQAFLPQRPMCSASQAQQMPIQPQIQAQFQAPQSLQSQPNMSLNAGFMTSVPVSTNVNNVAHWNNYNNITSQSNIQSTPNYNYYNNNQQFQFNPYSYHS